MNKLKQVYCKQIKSETSVCDWYECPYGNVCEVVERFYRFIRMDDDPDDIQFIDGILFYTPDDTMSAQLNAEERDEIAARWADDQQ